MAGREMWVAFEDEKKKLKEFEIRLIFLGVEIKTRKFFFAAAPSASRSVVSHRNGD
jgi:hypothetical protein